MERKSAINYSRKSSLFTKQLILYSRFIWRNATVMLNMHICLKTHKKRSSPKSLGRLVFQSSDRDGAAAAARCSARGGAGDARARARQLAHAAAAHAPRTARHHRAPAPPPRTTATTRSRGCRPHEPSLM